jgi:Arc/MetJ family transcription regulator
MDRVDVLTNAVKKTLIAIDAEMTANSVLMRGLGDLIQDLTATVLDLARDVEELKAGKANNDQDEMAWKFEHILQTKETNE